MRTAQRYGEFVAHLAPKRATFCEYQMVGIRRAAMAGEAGQGSEKIQVIPIPQPQLLGVTPTVQGITTSGTKKDFLEVDLSVK